MSFPFPYEKKSRQKGFSLVELMVVMAIIGTLAISANFSYSPANARLKQASRDLYSNMQYARMEAVKRNANWGVVFDSDNNTYAICAYDSLAIPPGCLGDNTTITLNNYSSEIEFGYGEATSCVGTCPPDGINYTSPDNIAYFTSKGLSPSIGYVYLKNNKESSYAIGTTSLAGVVKIKKWVCNARNTNKQCTNGIWE